MIVAYETRFWRLYCLKNNMKTIFMMLSKIYLITSSCSFCSVSVFFNISWRTAFRILDNWSCLSACLGISPSTIPAIPSRALLLHATLAWSGFKTVYTCTGAFYNKLADVCPYFDLSFPLLHFWCSVQFSWFYLVVGASFHQLASSPYLSFGSSFFCRRPLQVTALSLTLSCCWFSQLTLPHFSICESS